MHTVLQCIVHGGKGGWRRVKFMWTPLIQSNSEVSAGIMCFLGESHVCRGYVHSVG